MHFYPLAITCPTCGKKCNYRGFAYSADGELNFTLWCLQCSKECFHRIYDTTLREWAFKLDHPNECTQNDTDFLKERGILWNPDDQTG